jgi:MORN repeat variant
MTGHRSPLIAIDLMRSGADDVLIKPFGTEECDLSIKAVLGERSSQIGNRRREPQSHQESRMDNTSHPQTLNLQGVVREYYETTGQLMAELTYKKGKLDGVCKIYRKSGILLAEAGFRNGLQHGRTEWFRNDGQLKEATIYENGTYKKTE